MIGKLTLAAGLVAFGMLATPPAASAAALPQSRPAVDVDTSVVQQVGHRRQDIAFTGIVPPASIHLFRGGTQLLLGVAPSMRQSVGLAHARLLPVLVEARLLIGRGGRSAQSVMQREPSVNPPLRIH